MALATLPVPSPHLLAIYDLDRTITRLPTWTPFLIHAAWTRARWRLALMPVAAGFAVLHGIQLIDRRSLKEIWHRLMIGSPPVGEVEALALSFAAQFVVRHIAPGARVRLAADRAAGYRIVMATAAHRFYAAPIAAALGIDDLVATESVSNPSGRILSRINGENCYGPAKLRMIERWMVDQRIAREQAHVRFYSDHRSDVPTLAWADEAFAVNPHRSLGRVAAERGWPVLDWRG